MRDTRLRLAPGGPEVIERAKNVVVVTRRERELEERWVYDLARRDPPVECALEKVLLTAPYDLLDLRREPDGVLVSSSPSNTQMVVWKKERLLFGASQFQPPSASCSATRRCARLAKKHRKSPCRERTSVDVRLDLALKKCVSAGSNGATPSSLPVVPRTPTSRRAAAVVTAGSEGSTPVARSNCIVKRVVSQAGASSARQQPSAC